MIRLCVSLKYGPLEGSGDYASLWVVPARFQQREAPHYSAGPEPIKYDIAIEAAKGLQGKPFPAFLDVELEEKRGPGNRPIAYVVAADYVGEACLPVPSASGSVVDVPVLPEKKAGLFGLSGNG